MFTLTAQVDSIPPWLAAVGFVIAIGWLAAGWIKEHYLD